MMTVLAYVGIVLCIELLIWCVYSMIKIGIDNIRIKAYNEGFDDGEAYQRKLRQEFRIYTLSDLEAKDGSQ